MNDSLVKSTIVMVIVGKKTATGKLRKRAAKMKGRESMGTQPHRRGTYYWEREGERREKN